MTRLEMRWDGAGARNAPLRRSRWWSLVLTAAVAACGGPTGIENGVASVALSDDTVALTALGETRQVTATALDPSGSPLAGVGIGWSTSNDLVATVAGGLINAVGTGAATITAEAGGRAAYLRVTVQPPGAGATGPSFASVVQEVLTRRGCTQGVCHGGGAGYLALTFSIPGNYENLVNVRAHADPSTLLVDPGDAGNSYVIMKLEGRASGGRMPLNGSPLSATDLDNIKGWINGGAANN